jgi:hypothetical protein
LFGTSSFSAVLSLVASSNVDRGAGVMGPPGITG